MTAGFQPHWSELIRAWAAQKPLVLEVYAFGSRVKGGYTPESDLDIAIDVAGADEGEKLGNAICLGSNGGPSSNRCFLFPSIFNA